MGQVALGFRSLIVRALVFFIMAALLAWALGGTLWPSPVQSDLDQLKFNGQAWAWRAELDPAPEPAAISPLLFTLVHGPAGQPTSPFLAAQDPWTETLPLMVVNDHLLAAGQHARSKQWYLLEISKELKIARQQEFQDRLELVQRWTELTEPDSP